ncbi:MAG: peptidoglycan DD-metalloendopeptidase family protein [Balneolales bacterium]
MYRVLTILILGSFGLSSCDFRTAPSDSSATIHISDVQPEIFDQDPAPILDAFGIDESLHVQTHYIRRHESLSSILRGRGLNSRQIYELSNASTEIFNVRRMQAGRPLHLYSTVDTTGNPQNITYVVYEENQTDYVKFSLNDSIFVTRQSKPVEIKTRLISEEIHGSVYETMSQAGIDHQLTHRLAEVFAWQIDFYRIRPGDHFKVLFEERYVDGEAAGIGRIKAAVFNHRGRDFYAFHFQQNEMDEYFDEEGNSLRRQFLAAPLDYSRISSRFTHRRYHPVLKRNMPHHGTDYAAPSGTPIRAVGDGEITLSRYDRNNGNYIRIRHNSVYETGYLHMSRFARGIQTGTKVEQGQIIGYVGASGLATGSHLCFRFWEHDRPVDPRSIDLPPADPIKHEHRVAYLNRRINLLNQLEINPDSVINQPVIFALDLGYSGILMNNIR